MCACWQHAVQQITISLLRVLHSCHMLKHTTTDDLQCTVSKHAGSPLISFAFFVQFLRDTLCKMPHIILVLDSWPVFLKHGHDLMKEESNAYPSVYFPLCLYPYLPSHTLLLCLSSSTFHHLSLCILVMSVDSKFVFEFIA